MRETFIKIYVAERTNKAEIRPEEQSKKAELVSWHFEPSQPQRITAGLTQTSLCLLFTESRPDDLFNEIQLKGP